LDLGASMKHSNMMWFFGIWLSLSAGWVCYNSFYIIPAYQVGIVLDVNSDLTDEGEYLINPYLKTTEIILTTGLRYNSNYPSHVLLLDKGTRHEYVSVKAQTKDACHFVIDIFGGFRYDLERDVKEFEQLMPLAKWSSNRKKCSISIDDIFEQQLKMEIIHFIRSEIGKYDDKYAISDDKNFINRISSDIRKMVTEKLAKLPIKVTGMTALLSYVENYVDEPIDKHGFVIQSGKS
jgi:hypothetical protein